MLKKPTYPNTIHKNHIITILTLLYPTTFQTLSYILNSKKLLTLNKFYPINHFTNPKIYFI